MSLNLIQAVKDCLNNGIDTAVVIGHRMGVPIETVYQALVKLEGNGQARVIITGRNSQLASWGAL